MNSIRALINLGCFTQQYSFAANKLASATIDKLGKNIIAMMMLLALLDLSEAEQTVEKRH